MGWPRWRGGRSALLEEQGRRPPGTRGRREWRQNGSRRRGGGPGPGTRGLRGHGATSGGGRGRARPGRREPTAGLKPLWRGRAMARRSEGRFRDLGLRLWQTVHPHLGPNKYRSMFEPFTFPSPPWETPNGGYRTFARAQPPPGHRPVSPAAQSTGVKRTCGPRGCHSRNPASTPAQDPPQAAPTPSLSCSPPRPIPSPPLHSTSPIPPLPV